MKKILILLTFAMALLACNKDDKTPEDQPGQEQEGGSKPDSGENDGHDHETENKEETVEGQPLEITMSTVRPAIYESKPDLTFHIINPNSSKDTVRIKVDIASDLVQKNMSFIEFIEVEAKSEKDYSVTPPNDMEPGFYKADCVADKKLVATFSFGISPTKIISFPDMQNDFADFWNSAKQELNSIDMKASLTEIPSRSTDARKVYLVEMMSIPDRQGGEPVAIRGYYLEPQDGKKHPVIMHYYGYDSLKPQGKFQCPSGGTSAEYAEFYLSTRGQSLNNRTADSREPDGQGDFTNIYGDWFAYNFGRPERYYYRGAFMDCIQGIRFMATRQTSDMSNLFAEGSSQGGAFCYAAAALSDYPLKAIAPSSAFLGDFPDYFKIAQWPANVAFSNQGPMSDEQMYAFLSYFDTKNLATNISCSIIASCGLLDEICPPHTILAPFNNAASRDKEMHYYPDLGHQVPIDWSGKVSRFFRSRIM